VISFKIFADHWPLETDHLIRGGYAKVKDHERGCKTVPHHSQRKDKKEKGLFQAHPHKQAYQEEKGAEAPCLCGRGESKGHKEIIAIWVMRQ